MNEEIINGVNVAECGYFDETDKECNICGMGTSGEDTFCRNCKDNSNCYYKQLKRLQTDNELLKDANAHLKTELKQRYDEPDFKSFRLMGKTIDEWKQLAAENEENVHYLACMTSQRNKLKLALEEIRELLNKTCWDYTDISIITVKDIMLEVINEVLK